MSPRTGSAARREDRASALVVGGTVASGASPAVEHGHRAVGHGGRRGCHLLHRFSCPWVVSGCRWCPSGWPPTGAMPGRSTVHPESQPADAGATAALAARRRARDGPRLPWWCGTCLGANGGPGPARRPAAAGGRQGRPGADGHRRAARASPRQPRSRRGPACPAARTVGVSVPRLQKRLQATPPLGEGRLAGCRQRGGFAVRRRRRRR